MTGGLGAHAAQGYTRTGAAANDPAHMGSRLHCASQRWPQDHVVLHGRRVEILKSQELFMAASYTCNYTLSNNNNIKLIKINYFLGGGRTDIFGRKQQHFY